MHLVVATANEGKFREIVEILSDLRISFLPITAFAGYVPPAESGQTYAENAAIKARAAARFTGMWALADDSGLEVEVLWGQPGSLSSRFLGPGATDRDRNLRLLELMQGIVPERRRATFRCVVAIAGPADELLLREGCCDGVIDETISGAEGFGYDPVFVVPERGVTMASLPPAVKNRISHRARALEKAKPFLRDLAVSPELCTPPGRGAAR
jgi:XTP/dITP diphosphohydrolase